MVFPKFSDLVRTVEHALASLVGAWLTQASQALDYLLATVAGLLIGQPFLTQSAWYVDAVSGKDTNPGTVAAPLLTLGELSRHFAGRVFVGGALEIHVAGDFGTQSLALPEMHFADQCVIGIHGGSGAKRADGTITAFQPFDPAAQQQAVLTDATQDFSTFKGNRLRVLTSGAITWFNSLRGANTTINVGQFRLAPTPINFWGGANSAPAPGEAYVVEALTTKVGRFDYRCSGATQVVTSDVVFVAPPVVQGTPINAFECVALVGTKGSVVFHGCLFDASVGVFGLLGAFTINACALVGNTGYTYTDGAYVTENASCFFGQTQVLSAVVTGNGNLHDGDETVDVSRWCGESAVHDDVGHRVFRGNPAGGIQAHIGLALGAIWVAEALFWSEPPAQSKNGVNHALDVRNGCGFLYTPANKPTATGAVAGNDVVLAAGAPIAWAAVPTSALAPDNAYVAEQK